MSIRSDVFVSVNLSRTTQRTFNYDIDIFTGITHTFTSMDRGESVNLNLF